MVLEMRSEDRCNHTFETVKDLGNQKALLRCSKCGTRGYANKQDIIEDDEIEYFDI